MRTKSNRSNDCTGSCSESRDGETYVTGAESGCGEESRKREGKGSNDLGKEVGGDLREVSDRGVVDKILQYR
jgi:hypothetical protein